MHRYWDTIIEPVLTLVQPKTIVEIGSESGKSTAKLMDYCRKNRARVCSIDPFPNFDAEKWAADNSDCLSFYRSLSLNALPLINGFDLVFIDGDHNWYTVYNELKLIEKQCRKNGVSFPLVFLHDVGWPYARRDLYYDPENIPEAFRKPYKKKGMFPGIPDLLEKGGLNPLMNNSVYENDLQNGVLTGVEDFIEESDHEFEFLLIPGLYGLAILAPLDLKKNNTELAGFLKQFDFESCVKKHIENVEIDRIEKQVLVNKKLDDISGLQLRLEQEKQKIEQMKLSRKQLENTIGLYRRELEKAKDQAQKESDHAQKTIKAQVAGSKRLISWVEQLDHGVSALLSSKRWKMAYSIGEASRKIRRRPRVPMAEDLLVQVTHDFKKWKKQNQPGAAPKPVLKKKQKINSIKLPAKLPSVSVVVCVYNALDDVKTCLQSIVENTTIGYDLIVVNDGSDKATSLFLSEFAALSKNCRLIENDSPSGYTMAANQGLRASVSDYVVLLNSDTIVPKLWLERLIECGESDASIGILGPLSNAASWQSVPTVQDNNGDWAVNTLPANVSLDRMANIVAEVSRKSFPRVPFVNGFCFAIKRAVIDRIGYLDEETFPKGYGEENDYCLRADIAGFSLAIADHAYVYHAKSKSYTHERRLKLAAKGGAALKSKYPEKSISDLTKKMRKETVLETLRTDLNLYLSDPKKISDSPFKVLFVLPVKGGGGGAHSVVQEVFGMRKYGVDAQVAVRSNHKADFDGNYASLTELDEDLFFTYHNNSELISYAGTFNVVIGTIFHSMDLIGQIVDASPSVMPAYYIQDYEPLFFEKGSEKWKEAYDSYSLVPGTVGFAKTRWLCDTVKEHHGIQIEKVFPSIDENVYYPVVNAHKKSWPLHVTAMIRPATPRRGPDMTMKLLKRLKEEHKEKVVIHIFGCTNEDKGFLELERGFEFHNHGFLIREQVADLLRQSDIFVDFSTYQAFGRTGLEAMACGCAVGLPQAGGVHEYAVDGENALIVDTSSSSDCYEALNRLVTDQGLLSSIRKNALLKASEYSIKKAVISEIITLTEKWRGYCNDRTQNGVGQKLKVHSLVTRLTGSPKLTGSAYIRQYLPFSHPGFKGKFEFEAVTLDQAMDGDCDFLVVQRNAVPDEDASHRLLEHCKKNGIRTVYETDDDLFGLPLNHVENTAYRKSMAGAKVFAANADMIVTSSDRLKQNLLTCNPNVTVVPNALDERLWRPLNGSPSSDSVLRILYMGTYTHMEDLLIVEEAMKRIQKEYKGRVAFDVIGITRSNKKQKWFNSVPISEHNYPQFVEWLCKQSRWSIGIAPLENTAFNNCKSYIKYLDYAALGLVPLCSNLAPYQAVVRSGENGVLVDNDTESWYQGLKRLIDDHDYRNGLANNAYQDFIQNHTLKTVVEKWNDVFKGMI